MTKNLKPPFYKIVHAKIHIFLLEGSKLTNMRSDYLLFPPFYKIVDVKIHKRRKRAKELREFQRAFSTKEINSRGKRRRRRRNLRTSWRKRRN